MKEELKSIEERAREELGSISDSKKLEDFRTDRDTMDEVFENREQIEISKYYEKLPKPDLIAITEFEDGDLYYRMAGKEEGEK